MKSKKAICLIYLFVFFSAIWYSADIYKSQKTDEYTKALETYSYQLGYSKTYSPVFAPEQADETMTETGEEKVIYLTFDDGPTPRTGEVLDLLKEHDIKATFFVIKNKDEYTQYLKRAVEEGHTIGVHSATHKYKEIYKSVDAYLEDFTQCYDYIYKETGYSPTIFRFPGGSVNNYNAHSRREIVAEMTRRGFMYFDWNVESGDSANKMSADTIYNNIVNGCKGKKRAVIIMHDSVNKQTTVQALKRLIPKFKEEGWQFRPLNNEVKPMIFKMK